MNEAHLIGQRLAAFFLCRVERLTLADTERGLDLEGEELGAVLDDVLQLLRGLDPASTNAPPLAANLLRGSDNTSEKRPI